MTSSGIAAAPKDWTTEIGCTLAAPPEPAIETAITTAAATDMKAMEFGLMTTIIDQPNLPRRARCRLRVESVTGRGTVERAMGIEPT